MVLILIIFSVFFGRAEAKTVRAKNNAAPVVYASNNSSNISLPIIADPSAADGSAENDPIKVYVPLGGDNPANTQVTRLILASSTLLPKAPLAGASSYVLIQLSLSNSTNDTQYLWAAIKDASNVYKTIDLQTVYSLAGNTTSNVDSVFDIKNLCLIGTVNCTGINQATTAAGVNSGQYIIYYFLTSSDSMTSNTTVSPSDYAGGLYVKYYFSDVLPTGTTTINKIYNGDGRVFIDMRSGSISQMGDFIYKTMILKHSGVVASASTTIGAVGVSNIQSLGPPTLNGLLDVQNLTNNTDYYFSVSLVNKFLFHSPLSASVYARPEPIEALLQKQACFLLTAGFAGNHPVVEYFRHIRDHYLLHFSLGKSFVNFYYAWAPSYAQSILDRPWLAASIRALAHSLYFILNWGIIFAFILLAFILKIKYQRKIVRLLGK